MRLAMFLLGLGIGLITFAILVPGQQLVVSCIGGACLGIGLGKIFKVVKR